MNILEYDDFAVHKALHDALIQQVSDLKLKLQSGKASINFELMHFLKTWLTKHILGDDTQMGAYFIKVKKTPRSNRSVLHRMQTALGLA
jgi:hemerythrin